MEPRPHFNSQSVERQESLEKEIRIPPEIAWPFQMNLFVTNFFDESGERITELNDELVGWWADNYGTAFRDYCTSHPLVASHILTNSVSKEEEEDIVMYLKNNRSTTEEIQAGVDSLEKYKVKVVH